MNFKEKTMSKILLTTAATAFTGLAVATTIYLDDGTIVETDQKVYVSDKPLYTVEGSLDKSIVVTPADTVKPPNCEGFNMFYSPDCPGYEKPDPKPEVEVCYEYRGTWAFEVPCEE